MRLLNCETNLILCLSANCFIKLIMTKNKNKGTLVANQFACKIPLINRKCSLGPFPSNALTNVLTITQCGRSDRITFETEKIVR